MSSIQDSTRLKELRQQRNLSASALARAADVTRQTIYAMENGTFIPNTAVALRLARALECSVEDIFAPLTEAVRESSLLGVQHDASKSEQIVRLTRTDLGEQAIPAAGAFHFLPQADTAAAISKTQAKFQLAPPSRNQQQILIAGCDPALSLLAGFGPSLGLEIVPVSASSMQSLEWLKSKRVHAAGLHISGRGAEYNLPIVRRAFPDGRVRVVTFANWESGLVVSSGNPHNIHSVADLMNPRIKIVNRQPGSGARALLDNECKAAGISSQEMQGYEQLAYGHLPAAFAVAGNWAQACIATRSAARCFGLDFIPLRMERFDLVLSAAFASSELGEQLLDLLNRAALHRKLRNIAGYETTHSGAMLV